MTKQTIELGDGVHLDLQSLVTGRTFLTSVSRFGKSWTCRRIIEALFGRALLVVIDPESEYSTLREKFPFLIVGRDVPVVPEAAEFLAEQILQNNLSTIIDLGDPSLDVLTAQEFITRFIDRMIAIQTELRKPLLVIAEEADEFMPERGTFKSGCLQAMIKLAKKGGKRGMGLLMVTQRPAFISKYGLSQATNKIIGRVEWPADLEVIKKYLRVSDSVVGKLTQFKPGEFYVAGDFVRKPAFVKVGPVLTRHLGFTPEIVPSAPAKLEKIIGELAKKLPKIKEEKLAPAIPKVTEIESRIKEKFESAWIARLQRVEKQRDTIRVKTEAKYETEIADLKRKLDEAVRHATLKGGISDLLSHPLIKKNLSKLNAKQRGFVELLETKGSQDSEHCSLFLEIKPKSVPVFVHEVNRKIPKLIENVRGRYASRLVKLFPVTEEAKAEVKETEQLRSQVTALQRQLDEAIARDRLKNEELDEARRRLRELQAASDAGKTSTPLAENIVQPGQGPVIPVDVTLRRKLADFKVEVDREVLNIDESSWEGKILARGLEGFFNEPKGIGKIMTELTRRYGMGDSGGNRTTVGGRLTMLVSKGILDRTQEKGQWHYFATLEFRDRVRKNCEVKNVS